MRDFLIAVAWSVVALVLANFATSDRFVHGQIAGYVFAALFFSRRPLFERR